MNILKWLNIKGDTVRALVFAGVLIHLWIKFIDFAVSKATKGN